MAIVLKIPVAKLADTIIFGERLARSSEIITKPIIIYLLGSLGSGKTEIARAFIKYFNFFKVKSPTFSLVESYQNNIANIHHFDCYRLVKPEELEDIGVRDYLQTNCVQLIEWPQLAKGVIAKADITINLVIKGDIKRQFTITAFSEKGSELLKHLNKYY